MGKVGEEHKDDAAIFTGASLLETLKTPLWLICTIFWCDCNCFRIKKLFFRQELSVLTQV